MNKRLMKETAKAWKLSYKEVRSITSWIDTNIPTHAKSRVFTKLLRRHYEKKYKSI